MSTINDTRKKVRAELDAPDELKSAYKNQLFSLLHLHPVSGFPIVQGNGKKFTQQNILDAIHECNS